MPSNFRRLLLTRAARLFDLAVVSLTFVAALAVTSGTLSWPNLAELLAVRIKIVNILVFAGYLAVCSAVFSSCGFYVTHRLSHWSRPVREILLGTTVLTGVLFLLPFKIAFATYEFLAVFWLLTFVALIGSRMVGQQLLYCLRSRGKNLRNVVVLGEDAEATALANRLQHERTLGYRVVRVINVNEIGSQKGEAKA